MIANASSSDKSEYKHSSKNITKVTIKKRNNIVYLQTNTGENRKITNMSSIVHSFDVPLTFGASLQADGTPQRYFKGTLSDMKIIIY